MILRDQKGEVKIGCDAMRFDVFKLQDWQGFMDPTIGKKTLHQISTRKHVKILYLKNINICAYGQFDRNGLGK